MTGRASLSDTSYPKRFLESIDRVVKQLLEPTSPLARDHASGTFVLSVLVRVLRQPVQGIINASRRREVDSMRLSAHHRDYALG
jgi:hypothetical protein